jgi:hypothetical protein
VHAVESELADAVARSFEATHHQRKHRQRFTADEADRLLRIGRHTFDAHVARGDIAYIAVGMGLKRLRKRFDPEDIKRFRDR